MSNSPTIKQILQGFVVLLLLIGFVWLAFYALVIVLMIAAVGVAVFYIRKLLINQGILTPKEPADTSGDGAVIDADYTDVTEKKDE